MKKRILLFIVLLMIIILNVNAELLVRVNKNDLIKIDKLLKVLDIAGYKNNYIDLILNNNQLNLIKQNGIDFDIMPIDRTKADFLSIDEVYTWIDSLHALYPDITDIDTLGFTVENNPLIVLKINGVNPQLQGDNINGFLLMGLHHAREWQTVSAALFFADSILSQYNSDSFTRALIDSTFIIVFPLVNPDGYDYSRTIDNLWRKNRSYRNGYYGVDINRNYNGGLNGDSQSDWGFIANSYTTHCPQYSTYCGPYGFSERETQAVMKLIDMYEFDISVSLHSYGEMIIWPWGSVFYATPDSSVFTFIGDSIASIMIKKDYSGTYSSGQSVGLYPTTGDSDDWIYGYSKCIKGKTVLPFTFEIDDNFNSSSFDELDTLYRNVYKGIYLAFSFCEYARNNVFEIPLQPSISVYKDTLKWSLINNDKADFYTLYYYSQQSIIKDTANTPYMYNLLNFSISNELAYSGNKSFKDLPQNNADAILMTRYIQNIKANDTLSFYIWYDLETDYDFAYIEFSENGLNWFVIDTIDGIFNGNSLTWLKKEYDLSLFANKSGYFRLRVLYDDATLNEGMYIDNFYPLTHFSIDSIYADSIIDTFYILSDNNFLGEHYFSILPYINEIGYTIQSPIIPVSNIFNEDEQNRKVKNIIFNPLENLLYIEAFNKGESVIINIYNAIGRNVFQKTITIPCILQLNNLSAGIYFIGFDSWNNDYAKILILR